MAFLLPRRRRQPYAPAVAGSSAPQRMICRATQLAPHADSTTCRIRIGYTSGEGPGTGKGATIKGLFACIVGAGLGLLIAASPAFADHGTIHDKVGDVKFNPPGKEADYDITRSSWSVTNGRFIHTVSVRGRVGDPRTGLGPLPQLQIDLPNHKTADLRMSATRKRGDGVSVRKVSRHTVKYSI